MYKLELSEEQLKIFVGGLNSSISIIGQQLMNGINGSSALALKNLLPELIKINNELTQLDQLIDETNKLKTSA